VAQRFHDDARVHALGEQQRRARMPQIVDPHLHFGVDDRDDDPGSGLAGALAKSRCPDGHAADVHFACEPPRLCLPETPYALHRTDLQCVAQRIAVSHVQARPPTDIVSGPAVDPDVG
jgi:hypothetical protein